MRSRIGDAAITAFVAFLAAWLWLACVVAWLARMVRRRAEALLAWLLWHAPSFILRWWRFHASTMPDHIEPHGPYYLRRVPLWWREAQRWHRKRGTL